MPEDAGSPPDPTRALRELFGFTAFRPGQEELVRRALAGRDCLAVLPTGSGKSLCYQLPAMLRPTATLVVSPLIALMKDQVDHVPPALRDRATFIDSTLDAAEAAARLEAVADGRIRLLYAAPERLRQARFTRALRAARVGLVVVDEAHCVALWGHDFRPDYLHIRVALGGPLRAAAVMALTATATPAVATQIGQALGRDLEVIRRSVVRANLRYEVVRLGTEEDKLRHTLEAVPAWEGPGIVYARARQRCERIAELLRRQGVAAAHYHALLPREDRAETQERFLDGRLRVVVATTAFGMGVDKPDIRHVLLYNYPTSLEEYVQQVGRAGRDGVPSTCTLLATSGDAANLRAFARRDTPTVDELRRVWTALRAQSDGAGEATVAAEELAAAAELAEGRDVRVHCSLLERAGLLERHHDAGRAMRVLLLPPPRDSAERVEASVGRLREAAEERTRRMIAYAEASSCRHLQVAVHFGDTLQPPCGRCDVCAPLATTPVEARQPARPLPPDPARVIVEAVAELRWPLGTRGLVAMLRGSVAAPPSARRHPAFGALEAAPQGTVRRWVRTLVDSGHLARWETRDGFAVLAVARQDDLPALDGGGRARRGEEAVLDADGRRLFDALRAWRAAEARQAGVPAYVVLHDRTLRALASERPATAGALARIDGIGPRRLERWGEALLALLAGRPDA